MSECKGGSSGGSSLVVWIAAALVLWCAVFGVTINGTHYHITGCGWDGVEVNGRPHND